ncbi:hypothetical protein TanjilG_30276 [Lupinus angustifolius]|uniref:AP2/ERF domain-containing protein n=1 Tax=Lupinus angustifolius TaxID=3871 RepID=A0A4P1R6Y0_LUPAN|nr:PREDICTED: ethylene-responsive transcription factor ERF017-like [Lupinus angustifolius]OIW04000.1 hypothetical protein TanjilG_30276 [Lupinus angustifolius]
MAGTHDSSSSMQNQSCNNDLACSNNISKLYRGVRKRKWGKWVSEIRLPNSRDRIWLGSYDTQLKAARAFDAALYILRGTNACFNFPDTPLNMNINNVVVPRGRSLSPQEIQEVAAKFANYTHTQLETQEEEEEEEEPLESQSGVDSFGLFESKTTSSGSGYDNYDGKMDWTFLNMLDDDSNAVAGFDCRPDYCELDKTYSSGELLYYTQPPPLEDNNGDETEGNDAFYNHSILWSWDF